jgi:serine/threonine-protein kinase HipA
VSERNDFAILEGIGGECAGAITLLPESVPPPSSHEKRMRELTEEELIDVIAELPRRPLMAGEADVRLSLAGSQAKLPVIVHDATIALPLGTTPSTHIIKPEPERFPGLVANEIFCMTLARTLGLNVPAVAVRMVAHKPCIIIERYDRVINQDGAVVRIHQEDFCQAMGFPPERKYQQEGGPLLRECILMLRDWSTIPALDIRAFLDGLIFNVLIGNADAHGKNYSLIYPKGERRLAPLYDLVCTLAWPELSKVPAMKIGKCDSMETIRRTHWQKLAEETELGWPGLRERLIDLSDRTLKCLEAGTVHDATNDAAVADHVAGIIKNQASHLLHDVK